MRPPLLLPTWDASWSDTNPSSMIQFWVCSLSVSASWPPSHHQLLETSHVAGTWRPIKLTWAQWEKEGRA